MIRPAHDIGPENIVKTRQFGRYGVKMTRHEGDTWQVVFVGPAFFRWRASRDGLYIQEQFQRYTLFGWLLDKMDHLKDRTLGRTRSR